MFEYYEVPNPKNEGDECEGYVKLQDKKIFVKQSLSRDEKMHTALHEIFHAVLHRIGVGNDLGDIAEHAIIETLSACVVENFDVKWKNLKKP